MNSSNQFHFNNTEMLIIIQYLSVIIHTVLKKKLFLRHNLKMKIWQRKKLSKKIICRNLKAL